MASSPRITVGSSFDAKGIQQAQNSLKKFAAESKTGMDKFQDSLKSASQTMGKMGTTMSRNVTLPLVGIGVAAIKTATDFESSMTRIQSLVGFSAEAVGEMNDAVLEMAGRTATAPKELADALFFATSAGLDAKNSLEAVEQAAMASAIGLGDTATIVDLTTSAMNAYGVENLSAAEATNALTMAVRLGKLEPAQLAGAMGQVLPIASSMGIQFHEVGAAFASMSRTGANASASATGFKGILAGLLKPTTEASAALASMGLSTEDVHNSLRSDGLLATLQLLKDGLGGNTTALSAVFGSVEALSAVMNLLGEGADSTTANFAQMAEGANVLGEGFAIAGETAEFQFKQALVDLQATMVTLGNILLPIATDIAKAFSGLVSRFSELGEGTQKTIVVFGALLAAAGPVLLITSKMITTFLTLSKAFVAIRNSAVALKVAMVVLKAAMIGIPLLAVAAGIAAIVGHLNSGKQKARDFADGVQAITDRMKGGETATEVATQNLRDFIDQSPRLQQALTNSSFSFAEFTTAATTDMDRFNAMTDELMTLYGETFVGTIAYQNGQLSSSVTETMDGFRTDLTMLSEGLDGAAASADFWAAETERSAQLASAGFDLMSDQSLAELAIAMDEAERAALGTEDAMRTLGEVTEIAAGLIEDELNRVEQAADDLARGVDSAARSAADSFLRLSDEGKQNIDTFIEEMIDGTARLTVFQDNVLTVAGDTSAEFGQFLLNMGESGQELISQFADPANKTELDRAFALFNESARVGSRNMSDEFAKVDPEFRRTLQGLAGLTVTEMENIRRVATEEAIEVGTALMLGQVEGISRNSAAVQQALRDAVNAGIDAAIEEAQIKSPSRRMAEEVGEPMGEGIAVGIEESSEQIESAMRRTIQLALVAAAKDLDDQIRRISERSSSSFLRDLVPKKPEIASTKNKMSAEVGEPLGEGIADGMEKTLPEIESALRRTIQMGLVKAANDLDKEIRSISQRSFGSFLRGLVPRQEELTEIKQIVNMVTGEIKVMGREAKSASDVFVDNLITSSRRLTGFQDNVLAITGKTSGQFGLHLLEMGVDAEHLIADLADPDKVHILDQAFAAFLESTAISQRDMSSEFGKLDPAFAEVLKNLNLVVEEQFKPVTTKVVKTIEVMAEDARTASEIFVENLINSSKRLSGFQDNVLAITGKTSGEFGLFLLEMGVDAEHLIADLADPEKLHVLDQAFAAFVESTSVAQRDMSSEFAKVDPAFAAVLENLNLVVEEEMKPVIETASRSGRLAGSGAGNGIADGLDESHPAVIAARKRLEDLLNAPLTRQPIMSVPDSFSDGLFGQFGGGSFLSRQDGGIVPGPPSMPVPILAHGGEYVLSADIVDAIRSGGPSRGLDASPMASQSGPAVVIENYTAIERSDDEMLIGMLEFAVRGGRL